MSRLLSRPGAVAETPESRVAWHYGDPTREQRRLAESGAVVDRGDRDVLTVTGEQRLTWLHSITTQHLTNLAPGQATETMVLSPNGHIESHAMVTDDGTTTWLDTEPGAGEALKDFLLKMRFFTPVEIDDRGADWAVLTATGDTGPAAPDRLPVPGAKFAAGELPDRPTAIYQARSLDNGGWSRRTDSLGAGTVDHLVPRGELDAFADKLDRPLAGTWAFDAIRVAARLAAVGVDTDHRTIPHEVANLLRDAVHLDKGCYRGQETVARVHNLGKPPRMLTLIHLDGIAEHPPAIGTEITANGRVVGTLGTAVRHYTDGMIGLALLRRTVADSDNPSLLIGDTAAGL